MPTNATFITLTVPFPFNDLRPLVICLERPSVFPDFDEWRRGLFSHAVAVVNRRGLSRDTCEMLATLGEEIEFVQQALTDNRACCWMGDDQGELRMSPECVVSHRQPVSDNLWMRILRDGGIEAVRNICNAYLALFPEKIAAQPSSSSGAQKKGKQ